MLQLEKLNIEIKIQNDPFHKLKNNRKARNAEFKDKKIETQKVFTKLEHLKLEGLKQLAYQKGVRIRDKLNKRALIDILDPKIRALDKQYHLIVGPKKLRLSQKKIEEEKENKIRHEIREICQKALVVHDVDEACTVSNQELVKSTKNCFYLDRSLVMSSTLKILDHHKITLTKLQAIKLRPSLNRKKASDMTIELKRNIVQNSLFKWNSETDAREAQEHNIDAKIDEELFYYRCLRKRVVLYDVKHEQSSELKEVISHRNVASIGVQNVVNNLNENLRKSFEGSKWIEMVDTRFYRSVGKKFPLLNLSLFTKKNSDGEFQGQSMLGKFSTHEYRCTDKSYEANIDRSSAQQLQNAIFRFFDHYRSFSARKKYEVLDSPEFNTEFNLFETSIKKVWSLNTCNVLYINKNQFR